MKLFLNCLALTLIIALYSCTDDDNPIVNGDTNIVKCKIDGKDWKSNGTVFASDFGTHFEQLKIIGFNDIDSITIVLKWNPNDSLIAGEYDLSKDGMYLGIHNHQGIKDTASSGKVTITYIENNFPIKVSGTFNMNIKTQDNKDVIITNGYINSGNINK